LWGCVRFFWGGLSLNHQTGKTCVFFAATLLRHRETEISIFNFQFSIFNLLESYDSPDILDGGEGALACAVGSIASDAVE